ncbi:hypothetical protein KK083_14755 [Fulvivirgaceae bacterium PWU4]|uniref:DUF1579 domain-containing protein n=1 Tax=Chryseosolibacter histidini TaxID=2782349 RepID=A0AAP2DKR5_9BACT|nr:hypothetical protein [Chryseosolibacter histidini]MBT1698150.1 hypothetical protein [Chryseosolibacter histidini]
MKRRIVSSGIIACLLIMGIKGFCQEEKSGADVRAIPKVKFNAAGELEIMPSPTSSPNDFDFYVGAWKVHNLRQKKTNDGKITWIEFEATSTMNKMLRGLGNIDYFAADIEGKPIEGMTLRLFDPKKKLWSIYWASSNDGVLGMPPVVGSFENKVGYFFSQDIYEGASIITVYRWDARDAGKPVWSQTYSEDNGQTWKEWNWVMHMSK